MKHVKGAQAPFSAFDACVLASPTQRDDFLLKQALTAFEQGNFADALVYAEIVCRRHPNKAVPAILRARIVQAARPEFSSNAWYQAYCRDPENPDSQDQLLRAWCGHLPQQALRLGLQFLPNRCRAGTHESLLTILATLGAGDMAACWREGQNIHGMLWRKADANVHSDTLTNIFLSDEQHEWSYAVPADGRQFEIVPPSENVKTSTAYSIAWQDVNGSKHALPGSPLAFAKIPAPKKTTLSVKATKTAKAGKDKAKTTGICIIIPIYKGMPQVAACLQSVLQSRAFNKQPIHLLLIDDACPEPELAAHLQGMAQLDEITLLRNEVNLGYLETINRAVRWQQTQLPEYDVLLLNSDTLVHGNWLERLQQVLYSADDIGSVTPWSNNGEISSFPRIGQAATMPSQAQLSALDMAAAQSAATVVDILSCCGFCMLIRAQTIREIGALDGFALQRGYGEEVDWCLRASSQGWRHQLLPTVFVAHAGGVSFGAEKTLRVKQNKQVLAARYPHYYAQYLQFQQEDPLQAARQALRTALQGEALEWLQFAENKLSAGQAWRMTSLPKALPSAFYRIAVWQFDAIAEDAAVILALARQIASLALPVRLTVFGNVSEALWHTGVVEELPNHESSLIFPNTVLIGLIGCNHVLLPVGKRLSLPLAQSVFDRDMDVRAWLAQYCQQSGLPFKPATQTSAEKTGAEKQGLLI